MNIRFKITLFVSLFLVFIVGVLTFMSVNDIRAQGAERVVNYRTEALGQVKNHLKDLVDVAYETVDNNYKNLSDLDYLSKFYERKLHDTINTGELIIRRYQRLVDERKISLRVAKAQAKKEIGELRYDNGTGYIWINDTAKPFPKMVMHPTVPELDGKVLDDPSYNNAQGVSKNLFVAFVDITEGETKDGFVDYLWPKPVAGGLTEEAPKLSYLRRFDDWGWILGTGIYLDDARNETEDRIKESIKSMRYANGTGYFWINDNTLPHPTMIMHPALPELEGQVLDDPKFNNAQGVDKNLFTAIVEVTRDGNNEGFVDYLWPKPTATGLTARTPKESYVRLHQPTGWIIGSGVYIDNIDEAVAVKTEEIEKQISDVVINSLLTALVFIAASVVVAFMFANTLAKPIERLTEVTRNISLGKNLDEAIDEVDRKDEIGQLARAVVRLRASVKIMMARMPRS